MVMKTTATSMRARSGARPRFPLIGLRERRGVQDCRSIEAFSESRPGLPGMVGEGGADPHEDIVASLLCGVDRR